MFHHPYHLWVATMITSATWSCSCSSITSNRRLSYSQFASRTISRWGRKRLRADTVGNSLLSREWRVARFQEEGAAGCRHGGPSSTLSTPCRSFRGTVDRTALSTTATAAERTVTILSCPSSGPAHLALALYDSLGCLDSRICKTVLCRLGSFHARFVICA